VVQPGEDDDDVEVAIVERHRLGAVGDVGHRVVVELEPAVPLSEGVDADSHGGHDGPFPAATRSATEIDPPGEVIGGGRQPELLGVEGLVVRMGQRAPSRC
jgi:hypothetical protein